MLCYRDITAHIIREQKTLLTQTPSIFVLHDIEMLKFDPKYYPTIDQMTYIKTQLDSISDSLTALLKPIVKTDKRVAALWQVFIKLILPRSSTLPHPLAMNSLRLNHTKNYTNTSTATYKVIMKPVAELMKSLEPKMSLQMLVNLRKTMREGELSTMQSVFTKL